LHECIKTIDGKRIPFRAKTDAEVDRKMLEWSAARERGKLIKEIFGEWEAEYLATLEYTTQKGYHAAIERVKQKVGNRSIKSITAQEIKDHLTELVKDKKSQKTVRTLLLIYSLVFSFAAEKGYITDNVCQNVKMPKHIKPPVPREAATETDEETIKKNVTLWLLPYFLLYTGARKGEALAIQHKDINKSTMTISVTKSVYFKINEPHIKAPKTEKSYREIPILKPLLEHLPDGDPEAFLFSTDGGKTPLTKSEYQRRWEAYKKKTGISCTAHQLRHSYATLLYDSDVDVKDAQDLLGHATEAMTRDRYTHIRKSRRQATTDKINARVTANTQ
jgi:integrase